MKKCVSSCISDIREAIGLSICDFICVALGCALLVAPWRLIAEFPRLIEAEGTNKVAKMMEIVGETIVDLFYFFPLALILVTIYRVPKVFLSLCRQNYAK